MCFTVFGPPRAERSKVRPSARARAQSKFMAAVNGIKVTRKDVEPGELRRSRMVTRLKCKVAWGRRRVLSAEGSSTWNERRRDYWMLMMVRHQQGGKISVKSNDM